VLRAAGETETTQENIQHWLEPDEGDPEFRLLTETKIAALRFIYLFSTPLSILLHFPYLFSKSFCVIFCFINPHYFSPPL
jgi:hypothetical protein